MDDETWLHAKKAVELGFADKIMFAENQSADDLVANMSSRRQVMNYTAGKIKAKLVADKQSETKKATPSDRVNAAQLYKRLLERKI